MKDENKLRILGGVLRAGYETFKENTVNEKNKTYFNIMEACGRGIRKHLEKDPEFEKMYQGSDVIKTLKELADSVNKALK